MSARRVEVVTERYGTQGKTATVIGIHGPIAGRHLVEVQYDTPRTTVNDLGFRVIVNTSTYWENELKPIADEQSAETA